jgi:hypothetical protein
MRPARARLNVAARELVAWPGGVQDHSRRTRPPDQLVVGTLGLETNRAPLPHAAAGRARIAHTPGLACVYQRPQTLSSTRCRPTAPGIFPARPVPPLRFLLCRAT